MSKRPRKEYAEMYEKFFDSLRSFKGKCNKIAFCPKCNTPISQVSNGYTHVQRHHPEDVYEERLVTDDVQVPIDETNEQTNDVQMHIDSDSIVNDAMNDEFFKKCMHLINKCKYDFYLPSTTTNAIMTEIYDLCREFRMKNPSEQDMETYQRITESEYLQEKFLQRTYGSAYIKPQVHHILRDPKGNQYQYKYSTVSIEALTRKVLKNESIRNKLIHEMKDEKNRSQSRPSTQNKIDSFKDTSIWSRLKGNLKLELYLDDCQLAPTLCFNKQQKYLFVYASFADLPYQNRCHKDDIEMVLMANRVKLTELREKQGLKDPIGALLTTLKDEIKKLSETGVTITVDGHLTTFRLAISVICGDNLSIYELLGLKTVFANSAFVCRICAARGKKDKNDLHEYDIQKGDVHHRIIDETSEEVLKKFAPTNSTLKDFIFDGISGIHRFNCCPLDPLHDLAENGVIPIILKFVLGYWANHRGMSPQMIVNKFKQFEFYEGKPAISFLTKKVRKTSQQQLETEFSFDMKGIQVFEVLLKLEAILFDELAHSFEWPEFQLFLNLKRFTLLVHQSEFTNEDIIKLNNLGDRIVSDCIKFKLRPHAKESNQVWCKAHHLTHYGEMIRKFGPPYLYSTLRFERKHQTAKGVARLMGCWINPSKTVMTKQQVKRVLSEHSQNFFENNFFDVSEERGFFNELPANSVKMSHQQYPYKLGHQVPVLRKIASAASRNLYFQTTDFYIQQESGKIFCNGAVLKLWYRKNEGGVRCCKFYNNSLRALDLYKTNQFIALTDLHYSNDFMYASTHDHSDVAGWLFEWIL